ncbi:hypothetical protein RN001_002564 [Aquatica leii]|uniref:Ig-like domain-containing protein n=1 Tax=Aquatica leii TaxID=1421715 RepID=A0AAN7QNK7_9COLE|nr:hypothetical protein RN001_002564 [Aquatica leii]
MENEAEGSDCEYAEKEDEKELDDIAEDVAHTSITKSKNWSNPKVLKKKTPVRRCWSDKESAAVLQFFRTSIKKAVARILALPKGSKNRREEFWKLMREGNFYHNCEVLQLKKGELILLRRPTPFEQLLNAFHIKNNCGIKSKVGLENRKPIGESNAMLSGMFGFNFTSEFTSNILTRMRDDEITKVCKEDQLILKFGFMMFEKYSTTQCELIRQSMRQIGRFFKEVNKARPDIKSLNLPHIELEDGEEVDENAVREDKPNNVPFSEEESTPNNIEEENVPNTVTNKKSLKSSSIKKVWAEAEIEAVLKFFAPFIKKGIVPGKEKCEEFQLDLSYNQLSVIPSHAFESIPELRELKLSGNPIQKILNDAFIYVSQLVKLELSYCKIGTIETNAFSGLEKSLEWLKLDNNKLSEVHSSTFTILQSLHELDIAANPWNCTCKLRPLREWMLRKNVPFGVPPVCRFPNRISSRTWDKLDLDEFACVPEIIALDSKAHGIEGKNVTMTCQIAGIPEPNVRWFLKNKIIANLSGAPYSNGKKFYVVHLQNNSSNLTILTADVQDAGVYVCSAENKAGKSEASVTLAVSRKPPESLINKKVLVASVIAGLLFVLVACSVALCVCAVRRKQVMQWRDRNCRREDNYEKIEMNHKITSNLSVKSETAQNELMQVNNIRKYGEYRLVPGTESEQDNDKDEEGFDASVGVAAISKKRNDDAKPWNTQLTNELWNSSELPLLDTDDLHIPRRTIQENRDDRLKTTHTTSGIYNNDFLFHSQATTMPSHATQMPHKKKQRIENAYGLCYASSTSTELSGCLEDELEKKYPDLIEGSSSTHKGSLKAISEGNSVNDLSELYCTLPRKGNVKKKDQWKYSSTDSQFPLLNESRYSSSGGDSNSSYISSKRRLSDNTKPFKSNRKSNSYLNLTTTKQNSPPSPIRETPNSTPLLDLNALDNRVLYRRQIVSPSASPIPTAIANTYDYHAAQLERFLEEYRNLQKELTKMKETCENITKEQTASKYLDPLLGNSCLPISPISETANLKFKSTQRVLLPNSPNSNHMLDSSLNNFESELSKYILQRNSSPKTINNSDVFNN